MSDDGWFRLPTPWGDQVAGYIGPSEAGAVINLLRNILDAIEVEE